MFRFRFDSFYDEGVNLTSLENAIKIKVDQFTPIKKIVN